MRGCPDPETLARYVDGALFPEEAQRVEEHLARCASCARLLADTLSLLETAPPPQTAPGGNRRGYAVAATAVLVTAVAVAIFWWGLHRRDASRAQEVRAELFAALGGERPVLARVTGGMPWAPPGDVVRGARLPQDASTWRLAAAAERARVLADLEPQGPELGALASAHLLLGDADAALATLERAVAASPDDPGLRSDLAAAYIAHSVEGGPADLAQALEHASAALEKDPELKEARFNRALALQGLHLDATAVRAWQELASDESDPGWAAEARRHLDEARAELASKRPSGPPRDPMLDAELADMRSADGAQIAEQARAALAGAVGAREAGSLVEARRQIAIAEPLFSRGGPGRRRVELEQLAAEYLTSGSSAEVAARVAAVEREATEQGDVSARGRARWMLGLIAINRGSLTTSLGHYAAAIDDEAAAGDRDAAAWLQLLVSEVYVEVGDHRAAWSRRISSLAAVRAMRDPERARNTLSYSAIACVASGLPRVAFAIFSELDELRHAQGGSKPPEPRELLETSLWKARANLALRRPADVDSEIALAMAYLPRLTDPMERRWYGADLNMTRAEANVAPELAASASTRAIAGLRALGRDGNVPAALLDRARANRSLGRLDLAEADLRRGVELIESQQPGRTDGLWMPPALVSDRLYGELASLELERQRPDAAFALLERGRSRALRAAGGDGDGASIVSLDALRESLDPGTALVVFGTVDGTELAWRVDRAGSRLTRLNVPAAEIADMAHRWRADLSAGAWTVSSRELASDLYGALLAPLQIGPEVRRLVVVPGETLDGLPFAALVEPRSGRFLVEQHTVEIAPSVSVHLAAAARRRGSHEAAETAMVLGDPRADARLFPYLPSLPGAAEEAERVAAVYSNRSLAIGPDATREALLAGLRGRSVLHVAAHALVNAADPARSALILAPDATSPSGALTAAEIATLPLGDVRTVVLAACDSATGPMAGAEGSLSLARAFLAARVPSVVASLWPIADRRSVELVTALHAHLSYGNDPAASLRAAQLRMLASRDAFLSSPATWAAFEALGG